MGNIEDDELLYKYCSKLTTIEKLEKINCLIDIFVQNSEAMQGYVNINTFNGFKEKMWGDIQVRVQMNGNYDEYYEYTNLNNLLEIIEKVTERIQSKGG